MKTIGICGPSGSGKTTLAKMLCKDLDANRIGLDNYFLFDLPVRKYEYKGMNWELPENLDWTAIKHDLRNVQRGEKTAIRKINWDTDTYEEQSVEAKDAVIVEGFLLLHDRELIEMMDLTVYVHVPDEIGIQRRLDRKDNRKDYEFNKKWYEEVTFPEYAPRRKVFEERADLVLNGELPLIDNLERVRLKMAELENDPKSES